MIEDAAKTIEDLLLLNLPSDAAFHLNLALTVCRRANACPEDPAGACKWLKDKIEGLSSGPVTWSRGALTARRQQHTVVINGIVVRDGEVSSGIKPLTPRDATLATIARVRALRTQIDGPALLVWRCEPKWDGDSGHMRVRFTFEPDLWNDSNVQGPWTEKPEPVQTYSSTKEWMREHTTPWNEPSQTYPSKAGYAVAGNGVAAVEPVQERVDRERLERQYAHRELSAKMFDG